MLRPRVPKPTMGALGTIHVIGDSIAYGTRSGVSGPPADGPGWPTILGYTNLAVPQAMIGQTDGAPEILQQLDSVAGGATTLIVAGGTNNFGHNQTATTVARKFTDIEFMAKRKNIRNVYMMPIPPWGASVFGVTPTDLARYKVQRLEFNAWVRGIYGPRGQLVDVISVIGGDLLDPAADSGDGVHLLRAAQLLMASAVSARLP